MPTKDATPGQARPDLGRPHSARMYDYYLGGKDNYQVDRDAAEQVIASVPGTREIARANRAFMHRATRAIAEQGVLQFLDIGTGIPTTPNLHQTAQQCAPEARVVYVDNDPLVLAHARALLTSAPEGRTAYLDADLSDPCSILAADELRATIDLNAPVALSLISVMHFIPDEANPHGIVKTLLDALAPGSFLVLSHVTSELSPDPEAMEAGAAAYRKNGIPCTLRSRAEVARFFDGMQLLDPGIVPAHRWRPSLNPQPASLDTVISFYAAVARKP